MRPFIIIIEKSVSILVRRNDTRMAVEATLGADLTVKLGYRHDHLKN